MHSRSASGPSPPSTTSLSVGRGEVLGFLGPNGAGKSTTMKMITGFLPPTSGRISVCGHDVATAPREAQATIGYLPEGAPLYPDMTPAGLLRFCGEARGLRGAALKSAVEGAIERTELGGVTAQRIETLSKGFKRRVGLAQAILHDPDVLVLDEPTDGLDPNQKAQVRSLIREMSGDKVIVLSTHILEEVEAVCSRATVMAEGRLRFDGTPAELRRRSRFFRSIELHLEGSPEGAQSALEGLEGVASVEAPPPRPSASSPRTSAPCSRRSRRWPPSAAGPPSTSSWTPAGWTTSSASSRGRAHRRSGRARPSSR